MDDRISKLETEIERLKNIIEEIRNTEMINRVKIDMYREIIELNTDIKLTRPQPEISHGDETKVVEPEVIEPKVVEPEVIEPKVVETKPKHELPHKAMIDHVRESELFNKIAINKNFSKNMIELQKLRSCIFTDTHLEEYTTICKSHADKLTKLFKDKGFTDKKIASTIGRALTSFEMRLVRYINYFNTKLEVDDMKNLNTNLMNDIRRRSCEFYDPSVISSGLMNYSLAILPLKTNLQRVLFTTPPTIAYKTTPKKTSDPYSFYALTSRDGETRIWTMDCRLEELTLHIKNDLLPYAIRLFRDMYNDVFGDNTYREGYTKRCILTECDCEQLMQNILTLASNALLNDVLQEVVRSNSSLTEDECKSSKFNIQGDDNLQKRRWKEFKTTKDDVESQLFDAK
jgi:hypothetical protein